jgi:hypothetical protein
MMVVSIYSSKLPFSRQRASSLSFFCTALTLRPNTSTKRVSFVHEEGERTSRRKKGSLELMFKRVQCLL